MQKNLTDLQSVLLFKDSRARPRHSIEAAPNAPLRSLHLAGLRRGLASTHFDIIGQILCFGVPLHSQKFARHTRRL